MNAATAEPLNGYLLDDDAMRQFVRQGYVQVGADFPPDVHREIYAQLEDVFEREGNPGNNILPRIPRLQSQPR